MAVGCDAEQEVEIEEYGKSEVDPRSLVQDEAEIYISW
jgi:hypothetical protein